MAEIIGNAHGAGDGHPGAEAQYFYALLFKRRDYLYDLVVGKSERIAARNDDLLYLRMIF